jgi:hypothetical protein
LINYKDHNEDGGDACSILHPSIFHLTCGSVALNSLISVPLSCSAFSDPPYSGCTSGRISGPYGPLHSICAGILFLHSPLVGSTLVYRFLFPPKKLSYSLDPKRRPAELWFEAVSYVLKIQNGEFAISFVS